MLKLPPGRAGGTKRRTEGCQHERATTTALYNGIVGLVTTPHEFEFGEMFHDDFRSLSGREE